MSSKGSVSTSSSGIRQFGLYRTIDARTEEFLRLSRKRQIRQGCVCAAISTAITVIVVISIILVYEYSIIYESNSKTSLKQNWLSLMNKSEEAIPFEAKLNKAKINLDPMYLHFLPLILKTLKKNKYFDQIIEEDSTQTILNKEGNPENLYTKNIFSDSSNWMTMPTSRLFTIEYKTSPIVYFKYPTRNAEHFTQVRRVRDYQRIMNYVDKMISDRVAFTSTVPMIKSTFSFHKKLPHITYPSTTPMSKIKEHVTMKESVYKKSEQQHLEKTSKDTKNKWSCRCPKRMSRILSKLIKSIQSIIPDFGGNEQNISSCNDNKLFKTNRSPEKNKQPTSKVNTETKTKNEHSDEIINMFAADFNSRGEKSVQINPDKISLPKTKTSEGPKIDLLSHINNDETPILNTRSKTFYSIKPLYSNVESTLSSTVKIMKPSTIYDQQDIRTTPYMPTKKFIEATSTDYYSLEDTTKHMSKVTPKSKVTNSFKTIRNFVLQRNNEKYSTKLLPLPTLSAMEYEDYFTTPDILRGLKLLNVQSIEQAKEKMEVNNNHRNNLKGETEFNTFKTQPSHEPLHSKEKEYNNTWNILRKMGKLALSLKNQIHNGRDRSNNIKNVENVTENEYKIQKIKSMYSQDLIQSHLSVNKPEQQPNPEDVTLEEEIYHESSDSVDIIPEDNLKNFENLLNKINVTEIFNRTLKNEKEREKIIQAHSIENYEDQNYKNSRSMMPKSRPSYLEIQRNDWKREEDNNHNIDDYDINNIYL